MLSKIWFVAVPVVSFATVVVAGGCAQSTVDDMGVGGQNECSRDSDCKGDRVCEDGACVPPTTSGKSSSSSGGGSCVPQGQTCSPGDCCEDGGLCANYGGTIGYACGGVCTQGSQCTSGCCAKNPDAEDVCAPDTYCAIGSPCDSDSNCNTGEMCIGAPGWCSEYCSSSSQCGGNKCVHNSAGNDICFPVCSTNSDCSYYPGTTCQSSTDVGGVAIKICST